MEPFGVQSDTLGFRALGFGLRGLGLNICVMEDMSSSCKEESSVCYHFRKASSLRGDLGYTGFTDEWGV